MASLVLTAAGTVIGGSLAGPLGSAAGSRIAGFLGGQIDRALFNETIHREGARLDELSVQTSTYGKMIPLVYGSARIAGNILWAQPIKEVAETTESSAGGKGGVGGGRTVSRTEYSYYASLAIAICEGPIDAVLRIWADSKLLDLSQGTYRIYKGDEEQLPDSFIESFEGVGSTPSYRGLAYVVVEDFPLAAFGNRIPNFTFEVRRKVLQADWDSKPVEEMVKAMIMIPGSGEFVYDDTIQYKLSGEQAGAEFAQQGAKTAVNSHNTEGKANAMLALDQMAADCPNVEWIGVVVTWFGDTLDAATCVIKPGVEFQTGATTEPDTWAVGSYNRSTARQITLVGGSPRYGGTPDDSALLRYLDELRDRGYNIMFYPMFFMDVEEKPWRGRVTGTTTAVADFFTKTHGYNAFITHYANLVDGKVDAFVIGSELIGLTKVNDGASVARQFPAVDALVSLAATVKGILGSSVKVTYAADWSEYHHTEGGWYNLDPLWASSNIDVVGIDSYFPLTDRPQPQGYDVQELIDGWTTGEGYDWYYSDPERTTQTSLAPAYAWKNIDWWWTHSHVNPDGVTTAWTPSSKKIWFTEYGFPSVDGASNQPNVFYDPSSSESFFPRFSRGRIDNRAQRAAIAATEAQWDGSTMIERKFLWTWDARPFPFWPDLREVWTDGELWRTGHWVSGKFGMSGLAAIVADLCLRAGLTQTDFDVTRLSGLVDGFVITHQQSVRQAIEQLMGGYFFDAVESDGALKFLHRGNGSVAGVAAEELVGQLTATRMQELDLPQQVSVLYLNRFEQYQPGHQLAQRTQTASEDRVTLSFPLVMDPSQAQSIAEVSLYAAWMGRTRFKFSLPPQYLTLEPTDVIEVDDGSAIHMVRITQTKLTKGFRVEIQGVAEDASTYDFAPQIPAEPVLILPAVAPETKLQLLDLPLLPGDDPASGVLRFAASPLGQGWEGSVIYRSADEGQNYNRLATLTEAATCGTALEALGNANPAFWDNTGSVTVLLLSGELVSASEAAVLNGANLALLGDEILQFKTAEVLAEGKIKLSGLLRGRLGTEHAISSHAIGERFVLLDAKIAKDTAALGLLGLTRRYKGVSVGATLGQTAHQDFTYAGSALKPYAPVHVSGTRDGSGNLTLNWIRRTRAQGDWRDYADAPLLEESERYEVEILDGSDVVRTISATTPTASYTAAEQVVDFGSAQASVSVRIYQLSAVVGRGYGASGVV